MLKTRFWAIAGVLALAMLVVACGGGDDDESSSSQGSPSADGQPATQAAATIKRGGTLVATLDNNPKTFDPMLTNDVSSGAIVDNVFEGLYKYDEKYQPQPWLAESVDISPDSTEWTFHLRQGVKFHDGTEMDAEAVKFSMERVKNNPASVRAADAKTITDISVIDPSTVKVTLSEPFAPFPSRLTGGLGAVVSPTAVKAMGDEQFGLKPVGTGPFKFDQWQSDNFARITKFDGYWKQGADGKALPYLDGVEYRIITEPTARLTALQAGDVDVFAPNTRAREIDVPIIKRDPNLQFQEGPGLGYSGLWLTIDRPPFDNKALRQAVQYAIDRDEINQAIYEGTRTIAHGPIPVPLAWAVDPNYKPYGEKADLDKARQKLAEGGMPNGFEFDYWIPSGNEQTQRFAELVQAQLAKVGIKMNIQAADFNGVVIPKLQKHESNAYALGLTGGVDPDQHVGSAFTTGGGFNFYPYSNPQVDALIKQGRSTTDQEKRAQIYKDAVKLIMEDSPYIFAVYSSQQIVGNKTVHGGVLGPSLTTGFADIWKQ